MAPQKRKQRSKHRFLWVTDPWATLDHTRDTTLRLAREAASLGYESFWCDVHTVRMLGSQVILDSAPMDVSTTGPSSPFPTRTSDLRPFSSVHYRVDPPVDLAYLHPLQLLNLSGAQICNPPAILFSHNEKLEAVFLKDLMPETLVSSRWEDLQQFGKDQQRTVLKPLHQAQSKGVKLLSWLSLLETEQNREILATASDQFTRPVLLQRYLPGISDGEQRLWFLDGKLLACVRKMPLKDDFRVDIDRGSTLRPTKLSPREKNASAQIGKFLAQKKIRLAAVDLIEGLITDFNFTSPGLITQMEEVLGENLAKPIVEALAK